MSFISADKLAQTTTPSDSDVCFPLSILENTVHAVSYYVFQGVSAEALHNLVKKPGGAGVKSISAVMFSTKPYLLCAATHLH